MRLHFKEDPKEWRKVTLLGLIGPTVILALLRHRRVISMTALEVALSVIALGALCAWWRPRWFRGHYRFTTRVGYYTVQVVGRVVLGVVFLVILTPFGWILRGLGMDFLQLKAPRNASTYWQKARPDGSLDSMF